MKVRLLLLSIVMFVLNLSPGFCLETTTNGHDDMTNIENFIEKMSPEEKIGQLFMYGILNEKMSHGLSAKIQRLHPGALILFRKNIKTPLQTAQLIYDLQLASYKYSKSQMLIAVDQEGGDVVRIPTEPPLPTALALGRSKDFHNAFEIGKNIGNILKNLGIHINLAPVLDLSSPGKNSFIQTRSFGNDPEAVANIAEEFSRGVETGGVLSTAKHFPGLGDLKQDSHKEIADNPISREDFFQKYLIPYEKLIQKNSLSCVMMTHLVYPNVDPSLRPATFSPTIIGMLKEKLHFHGLIMTDDIEMAGAKYFKNPGARAVEAFLAGNDILMVAWNARAQAQALAGVLSAYKKGIITDDRLNLSLRKILAIKRRLGLIHTPEKYDPKIIFSSLRSDSLKIAIDAVLDKILKNEFSRSDVFKNTFPQTGNVLVLTSDYHFYKTFSKSYAGKTSFALIGNNFRFDSLKKIAADSKMILFDVRGPKTSLDLTKLPKGARAKTIVVNSRYDGSVKNEKDFLSVLEISMKHPDLGRKIGAWLRSQNTFRLPASASSN